MRTRTCNLLRPCQTSAGCAITTSDGFGFSTISTWKKIDRSAESVSQLKGNLPRRSILMPECDFRYRQTAGRDTRRINDVELWREAKKWDPCVRQLRSELRHESRWQLAAPRTSYHF